MAVCLNIDKILRNATDAGEVPGVVALAGTRASPQRTAAMSGADQLWARHPESERFQMAG